MFLTQSRLRVCVLVVLLAVVECESLNIISRKQWGALPPKSTPQRLPKVPTDLVVIHHSASPGCKTRAICTTTVRGFQKLHMTTNGWNDIGYNFVVGEDGNVYEGRGWNVVGAHAVNANSRSVGICVIGDFTGSSPDAAAISALKSLISFGVAKKYIVPKYKLSGHRQITATACPGNKFYAMIKNWPHFSPKP